MDEICSVAMWPFGRIIDHHSPGCVNQSTSEADDFSPIATGGTINSNPSPPWPRPSLPVTPSVNAKCCYSTPSAETPSQPMTAAVSLFLGACTSCNGSRSRISVLPGADRTLPAPTQRNAKTTSQQRKSRSTFGSGFRSRWESSASPSRA